MRHVVLGCNTQIGVALSRVLGTLDGFDIILCSPNGKIPKGIAVDRVSAAAADILDPYTLLDIFQEGDIVYNAQVLDDKDDFDDVEFSNHLGLINLLGIATISKVRRLVTYLPGIRGWDVPFEVTENAAQGNPSEYHSITNRAIELIGNYRDGEKFGWSDKQLVQWIEFRDGKDSSSTNTEISNKSSEPNPSASPPLIGMPQPASGPTPPVLSSGPTPPVIGLPQAPSLGPTSPPELSPAIEEEVIEDEEIIEEEVVEIDLDRVEILVAMTGRLFGAFDMDLTKNFCECVRLERMTIIGKWNNQISWLVPEDAARAILIMGDSTVEPDIYNIFSFTASPMEILAELDKQNYSTLKLRKRSMFFARIRNNICKKLSKLHLCRPRSFDHILKFNMMQVLNQDHAINKWDWEPKFDLKSATENALNWYINHVI